MSPFSPDLDLIDFLTGMAAMRMTRVVPQQVVMASVLSDVRADGLPTYAQVVETAPRRASKTTAIWAVLLGRCIRRAGYQVVTTAQTGLKARERFLQVARVMMRYNVGDYRVLRGAGQEAIEWNNGSRLWVVPPLGDAFPGDGAHVVMFDEAQVHTPAATSDLLGGALALMDTVPDSQLIVTGTAGKARAGMLWDYLELGRRGAAGIVEYAAPDTAPIVVDVKSRAGRRLVKAGAPLTPDGRSVLNEPVLVAAHPGIGTLTTLDTVRERFKVLPLLRFQREYAGQWPFDVTARAIDPADWRAARVEGFPPMPDRFALAYDIAPDQSTAALVAAWRDDAGTAWWEVLHHEAGDAWLPKAIFAVTRAHVGTRVGFDNVHAGNVAVADRLTREARPKPHLVALSTREITSAAAQVAQDLTTRRLRFKDHPGLNEAADVATRRHIGDASWAWGRRRSNGDISTLVAATNALKVYDLDTRAKGGVRIVVGRGGG